MFFIFVTFFNVKLPNLFSDVQKCPVQSTHASIMDIKSTKQDKPGNHEFYPADICEYEISKIQIWTLPARRKRACMASTFPPFPFQVWSQIHFNSQTQINLTESISHYKLKHTSSINWPPISLCPHFCFLPILLVFVFSMSKESQSSPPEGMFFFFTVFSFFIGKISTV